MQESMKLQLRLPEEVKEWLKGEAGRNDRSMNNQVVAVLREKMTAKKSVNQSKAVVGN